MAKLYWLLLPVFFTAFVVCSPGSTGLRSQTPSSFKDLEEQPAMTTESMTSIEQANKKRMIVSRKMIVNSFPTSQDSDWEDLEWILNNLEATDAPMKTRKFHKKQYKKRINKKPQPKLDNEQPKLDNEKLVYMAVMVVPLILLVRA